MSDVQTNKAGPRKDEPEISQDERAFADLWEQRIKSAKSARKDTADHPWSPERLKLTRNYVNGKQHDDGSPGLVRTNLIYSTLATLLPYIYAKNPDISVMPSEAVEPGKYKAIRSFCKTLELVLRRIVVIDGKLKKRAKSALRSVLTTGVGWLKISYQREYRTDPIIKNRIADIQDNLSRVEMLSRDISDKGDSQSDHDAKRAELKQQLMALENKVEVVVSEGIVIDRVLTEDIFILDNSLRDFDTYPQSRAIAHRVWFTKDLYSETFGGDPPSDATSYKQPKDDDGSPGSDKSENWYAVFEIWDRISQTVYTKCDGSSRWCRPPYQPDNSGERWYPFFGLAYNLIDGQFEPLSDVILLKELQDEFNTTRTNYADHRKENLPGMVVRKGGGLNEGDIDKIVNRKINEVVVVEGDPNRSIGDDLMEIKGVPIDPLVYDVSAIRQDMDLMSGLTDASRSNLTMAKTLGEAQILKESMMSRTSERQDTNEDFMQEICQFCAEVLMHELSEQQVMRITGPGATWPKMSKEEIFDMVRIDIRAGSTGKPNKQDERQQWIEFMPTFQEMVVKVIEMRQAGHIDMATAMTEMIKETLRRFDERLDIETFIPGNSEDDTSKIGAQLGQMQQKIAEMEQENAQLRQAADVNQTKIQIENERIAADAEKSRQAMATENEAIASKERIAMADANARAVSAENVKTIEIEANKEIETAKIVSNERIEMARCMSAMQKPEEPGETREDVQNEHMQDSLAQFNTLLTEFMRVMSADRIAVRDQNGKLTRTRIEMPASQ